MIETPVQATPMKLHPTTDALLSQQADATINALLRDVYKQAYLAAAKQLRTPAPDTAKGLLNFDRFFMPRDDVLKLPDEQRRKKIGERIRLHRQKLKLTQRDLADKMGIAPQTLSIWEIGEREPAIKGLIGLSKALGVSTDDILGLV